MAHDPGYDCVSIRSARDHPKSVSRAENFERLRSEVAADHDLRYDRDLRYILHVRRQR